LIANWNEKSLGRAVTLEVLLNVILFSTEGITGARLHILLKLNTELYVYGLIVIAGVKVDAQIEVYKVAHVLSVVNFMFQNLSIGSVTYMLLAALSSVYNAFGTALTKSALIDQFLNSAGSSVWNV
jgi:hypothetical protein